MMRRFLSLFFALFFACSMSFAGALPVSKMQNAVSGTTQAKMQARGFASNDPRWVSTLTNVGSAIVGAVAGAATVTALGVTAPAWATAAAGAAVMSVVALTVDAAVKWIFKPDGTVQVGDNPASVNTPAGLTVPPKIYYVGNVVATSPEVACNGQPYMHGELDANGATWSKHYVWDGSRCNGWQTNTSADGKTYPEFNSGYTNVGVSTGNTTLCPGIGLTASAGKCPASNFPEPAPAPVKTVSDAAAALSDAQKAQPLNPQVIADIANHFWQEAASAPGYNGLPYDATNPVTAADAATWQATNPDYWPTVGDYVAPQPAPNGGSAGAPFSMPTSSTPQPSSDPAVTPNTGTNPSTEPLENLGTDPGIGAPALEPIPTAQQILQPLLNLFPTLRNFAVPNHSSVCPKWTIHMLNRDYVLQDHCPILENIRPTLYSAMAVAWVLIALFIILAA